MAKKKRSYETTFNTYTVNDFIGEGGAGRVYNVGDDEGTVFALKILKKDSINSNKVKRFKNELHFCKNNKHKNIMSISDFGYDLDGDQKIPFYVMPLFPLSLREVMKIGVQPHDIPQIFFQLLDGVEAAHMLGVTHRDLKPENILCDKPDGQFVIADFGIAGFTDDLLHTYIDTKDNERLANFQYSAPEQRQRGIEVDHRADIYALGLILNELFTGKILAGAGYQQVQSVSESHSFLDDIIDKMVQQAPEERYQAIGDIKKELNVRQDEYISLQKLSQLKETVIPTNEIDDPLIREPIEITGTDYIDGNLILKLSKNTNPLWEHSFHTIGSHFAIMRKGPDQFGFDQSVAVILAQEHEVQQMVDLFKNYARSADAKYKAQVIRDQKATDKKESDELKRKIEEEEKRKRILETIKI